MKKIVASVMILAFFTTGCTGSFSLTHKLYSWHRSQPDKWSDELCFLLVSITPIYSLAIFADAIIFNSIEFWTGKNPVDTSFNTPQTRFVQNGKQKMLMSYNDKTDEVKVALGNNHGFIFQRTPKGIIAKNDKGQVLYSAVQSDNGDVAVYNGSGKLVKNYPAGQIALLKQKYIQQ
ncbi:MAG: DUF3332 family protein [Candidatus Omnitrophica bacterium]|nr:DUF3332 family protein [Candidatus Omnitrophota bacterium]MDE2009170.1 DUF3332 family protein [Candidatus Omnitrophota bacterium]MDE2213691.1 DUF3332 family protein [Candidatus Omnitrophota bacterium]MDE2230734.1 DUF3332 family protein [Candidatus Omnitrophota bacterium]